MSTVLTILLYHKVSIDTTFSGRQQAPRATINSACHATESSFSL